MRPPAGKRTALLAGPPKVSLICPRPNPRLVPLSLDSTIALEGGARIPVLGFGTWQLAAGPVALNSVAAALKVGYRHIDTARIYGNEAEVGAAVRASGLKREEVFITTKVWGDDQGYASTLSACDASLKRLGTAYIDLYLIHWPVKGKGGDTWRAFEKLQAEGKCRAIGVSNYTPADLDELSPSWHAPPAANQVEMHPFEHPRATIAACRARGIAVEAYSPLSRGKALSDARVKAVAKGVGKSPAQVLVRWGLQHGAISLPRSSRPEHIRENAAVFDFELARADMDALDALS